MAIKDFLFRCPNCGHDPMGGAHDEARCSACGLIVTRNAGSPTCLKVNGAPGFASSEVPAAHLADRIEVMGGALPRATGQDGSLSYSTDVRVRAAGLERPIRYGGLLLGFAERFVTGAPGRLQIQDDALILETAGERRTWLLETLHSIQTSSSALQVTTGDQGVAHFRFVDDSPRRWDELLRHAISRRWELLGKGTVLEFQPRIRAEAMRP